MRKTSGAAPRGVQSLLVMDLLYVAGIVLLFAVVLLIGKAVEKL